MFTRKDQLLRKTGPDGIGRYDFLRLLKKEFQETYDADSKKQILANLCNFAYDPINFEYMRSLLIVDLFLEQLSCSNEVFVKFAVAAICNLSADPVNRDYIIQRNGIQHISPLLNKRDENIILDVIVSLLFLRTDLNRSVIYSTFIVNKIKEIQSNSRSKQISNITAIFLEDYSKEFYNV